MKHIEVSKIIDPISASDGAGVKLKRSIGVEPNYFDPVSYTHLTLPTKRIV